LVIKLHSEKSGLVHAYCCCCCCRRRRCLPHAAATVATASPAATTAGLAWPVRAIDSLHHDQMPLRLKLGALLQLRTGKSVALYAMRYPPKPIDKTRPRNHEIQFLIAKAHPRLPSPALVASAPRWSPCLIQSEVCCQSPQPSHLARSSVSASYDECIKSVV